MKIVPAGAVGYLEDADEEQKIPICKHQRGVLFYTVVREKTEDGKYKAFWKFEKNMCRDCLEIFKSWKTDGFNIDFPREE